MVGDTCGKDTVANVGFLSNVLKSKTSVAVAIATRPARRTATMVIVRINFIYEPPFSMGTQFNPNFWYVSLNHLFLLLIF
jgi:hypothetical protein